MTFSNPQVQDAFDEYEMSLAESIEHLNRFKRNTCRQSKSAAA